MDTPIEGGDEPPDFAEPSRMGQSSRTGPSANSSDHNRRAETARAVPSLKSALRTARIEDAERSRAIADVRGAELARLDMLRDAIEPVLAQIPSDVEMFDTGLMPGPQPRLFIDMIAFVEMAHDKRLYRFVQDTRQGRMVLAESERLDVMSGAVTSYIARRLIEREKALTAQGDQLWSRPVARRAPRHRMRTALDLMLRYLGIVALCVLLWVVGWALYQHWMPPS